MPKNAKYISETIIENCDDFARMATDLQFGSVRYPVGGDFGPRMQVHYQIFLLLEGSVKVRQNRHILEMSPGEAVVLKPGTKEHFQFSREMDSVHSWCAMPGTLVPPDWRDLVPVPGLIFKTQTVLRDLIEQGIRLRRRHQSPPALAALAKAALAIALDSQFSRLGTESERLPPQLDRAMVWAERHFTRPGVQAGEWARASGVSVSHLNRLFSQHLGQTAMQWFWTLRTREAISYLQTTSLHVDEIAERCGFQCPFHLSRKVREATGQPPRDLRRRNRL